MAVIREEIRIKILKISKRVRYIYCVGLVSIISMIYLAIGTNLVILLAFPFVSVCLMTIFITNQTHKQKKLVKEVMRRT